MWVSGLGGRSRVQMYIPGQQRSPDNMEGGGGARGEGGNWYSHPICAIHYSAPQKEGRQRKRNQKKIKNKNPTEDGKRRHTHKKSQEAGGQTEKGATSCDHQRDRQPASQPARGSCRPRNHKPSVAFTGTMCPKCLPKQQGGAAAESNASTFGTRVSESNRTCNTLNK